jgi:nicotinamide mononucleotide transporter
MQEVLNNIKNAFLETTLLEWIAVLTGTLYVILISYKQIIAWLFALISSLLYVYICFNYQLYLESFLQVFYVAMAVFGWINWKKETTNGMIIKWPLKNHIVNIVLSTILTLILGFTFSKFTNQANPYTDAFTTVFSLTATFMVTKRVLENWIYWIIIDGVSIFLYSSRSLYLTSVLFFIFTTIAVFGYLKWKREFKIQTI